jgi:hypothetical protein
MSARLRAYIRQHHVSLVAVFLALSGGVAWASHPGGQNTINSADIINGEVKEADVGQGAVASPELKNDSVANGDVAPNSLTSGRIADGSLTGTDVANNSLKGADIDETTLDVGDAARAYARVNWITCFGTPVTCSPSHSKGISSVIREETGHYCVTAPGIDPDETPAAVTVDWFSTGDPAGNASAMTDEFGCGPGGEGFEVVTERQVNKTVPDSGGNPTSVAGPAEPSNVVSFTIVIP